MSEYVHISFNLLHTVYIAFFTLITHPTPRVLYKKIIEKLEVDIRKNVSPQIPSD